MSSSLSLALSSGEKVRTVCPTKARTLGLLFDCDAKDTAIALLFVGARPCSQ
ncbi:hypothetical protein [Hoylesella nanceiensis]|uniref:hypothetical protein n=1 Tax=Hoylesella nanceiensis TaxID=425941 RepID=UPI001C5EA161|nr:hypothetical protein [Hoylesella nanceiensis]MBW4767239.1 hypothetical protein [Hoylesella nanceiensis]